MLSEQMVESLLVGGIAGAGLVLTTLTLAAMKSEELLSHRVKKLKKAKTEYQSKSEKPEEETQKIADILHTIAGLKSPPSYLGGYVTLSFLSFILSSLLALLWLLGYAKIINQPATDFEPYVEIVFAIGILSFLGMGLVMIADLESFLKSRYEELKKVENGIGSEGV